MKYKAFYSNSILLRIWLFFAGGLVCFFLLLGTNQLFLTNRLSLLQTKVNTFLGVEESIAVSSWSELTEYLKRAMQGTLTLNNFPSVNLVMSQTEILKLNDRKSANRVYVKAKINLDQEKLDKPLKGKVRLKGDRKIHNESIMSQSYRVNLKGDDRLFGLEEFSIQRPIVRGYTWELLIANIFSSEGLLTLNSVPINFSFNGDPRGIYFIEEVPNARTVERQDRKAGPIYGLDEVYGTSLNSIIDVYEKSAWEGKEVFNYASEILSSQFIAALNGSEFDPNYFDFEEWAKYFALHDLFGSYHGTVPKSVRFYYNPVMGKYQPLLFDAHKGAGNFQGFILGDLYISRETKLCDWICEERMFYMAFFENKDFRRYYSKYLEKYSSDEFLEKIERVYNMQFKKLDNEFYSSFSASDGVFFRGAGLYFLNLTELKERSLQMQRMIKLLALIENRASADASVNKISDAPLNIQIPDNVQILELNDFSFQGTKLEFKQPTLILLTGSNKIAGLSEDENVIVTGPVTLVQVGGNLSLKNVVFRDLALINVSNRNWSGLINIIGSDAEIGGVHIIGGNAEDSINIINSTFDIGHLTVENSKSDAVDLDFSSGSIKYLDCTQVGNDCLDTSGSSVEVGYLVAHSVGDKGVSAGENSNLQLDQVSFTNVGVGLVSKDGSILHVDEATITKTPLAVAAYVKKPEYDRPRITLGALVKLDNREAHSALIGLNIEYQLPDEIAVFMAPSSEIEGRMYGVEFGKKTLK